VSGDYWRGAAEDEAMQDEHGFIWLAMLETVDRDLTGLKALDAGCNRGGFLRLLADRCGISEGYGYDPAAGAVADARSLSAGRPLVFEASSTVPPGWDGFDVAFSHEVLYLLDDLSAHASAISAALKPGGCYYAVIGMHAASPLMSEWHAARAAELGLPRIYDLDEVVSIFEGAGFEASAARLKLGFVPLSAHRSDHGGLPAHGVMEWLDYYSHDKLLLRFSRPRK
jgi:SAM-dependent methyltransferase